MADEPGCQPVSQRHWLLREPDSLWQVFVVALIAAAIFAGAGYLVGRNGVSALAGAAGFGLVFVVRGVIRLR